MCHLQHNVVHLTQVFIEVAFTASPSMSKAAHPILLRLAICVDMDGGIRATDGTYESYRVWQ